MRFFEDREDELLSNQVHIFKYDCQLNSYIFVCLKEAVRMYAKYLLTAIITFVF